MARTKLPRLLPPLPSRLRLDDEVNNGDVLLEMLRTAAADAQGDETRLFYSIREVAAHFRVPLSKVARIYRQLEEEGVVSRIRSSGTILRGSAPTRRLIVRHIVAVPASISAFITLQDYRVFLIKVRREFQRHGLETAITFYEDRSDTETLVERIQQSRADLVLWYRPDSAARLTAPRLRDLGIAVVGISDGGLPGVACHYGVCRTRAIHAILQDWMACGIRRVRIARGATRATADEERLEAVLSDTLLDWHLVTAGSGSTEQFLGELAMRKNEAIILLASVASFFLMRAPRAFNDLLRNCRVALVDGPVSMPFSPRGEASVDLVLADWQAVAERIAADIISRKAFRVSKPVLFEAAAMLKAPFKKFAQRI